jgi:hypothetical protein
VQKIKKKGKRAENVASGFTEKVTTRKRENPLWEFQKPSNCSTKWDFFVEKIK